jgi:hypothetical protein
MSSIRRSSLISITFGLLSVIGATFVCFPEDAVPALLAGDQAVLHSCSVGLSGADIAAIVTAANERVGDFDCLVAHMRYTGIDAAQSLSSANCCEQGRCASDLWRRYFV